MAYLTESQIIEKLCKTFNTRFSGSRNVVQSLVDTIAMSDMLHPGLRGLGGKDVLSLFKDRMNVWDPGSLRELTIDVLVYLIKEKVTTDSSKKAVIQEINEHLLPINFW
ncbi:hypothetical protein [Polynucleobacter sp. AP-Feld-500C-C5]|uniref:hypothetical protein n=1 Tax=Polynucleobacter sp. AP-Feld-500C-C5 TaxID=2576924 RepID=UPI001C0E43F8|nr:hypothetical protein [Polynucleobacter sp. AP-Feld-500C-C5]MBU3633121.1 hypothetical protein [Polynucleobacter sp. AP-Feld-500C-C5]